MNEVEARGAGRGARVGFSLVEILLVMALLSLIMLALMSVFNSTQSAFRSSVTQTDVLEGGRATMDLMSSDFRQMSPSGGYMEPPTPLNVEPGLNSGNFAPYDPVNFWLSDPSGTVTNSLIGVSNGQTRTNQVQSFFILSRVNDVWKGVGYFVDTNSTTSIDPLYRYDSSILPGRPTAWQIYSNYLTVFNSNIQTISDTNIYIHHLLDGVLHLNVRAFDTNGVVLTNGYAFGQGTNVNNARFYPPAGGEVAMYMCSNTLPAAVEIQMGVIEDRTLQRASSMAMGGPVQINYLAQQAGKLHLFRQRVTIPNVDPAAYQQ